MSPPEIQPSEQAVEAAAKEYYRVLFAGGTEGWGTWEEKSDEMRQRCRDRMVLVFSAAYEADPILTALWRVGEIAAAIVQLYDDPRPGLATWNIILAAKVDELSTASADLKALES